MNDPQKPDLATPNARDTDLVDLLSQRVVGQPLAMRFIVPYIEMHQAGLSPEGRPAGVFLLLGPTGTGKTRTVEALAEVLHGSEKQVLKIDCGEYQSDHEVAKLIGAPPGYVGHRETQPVITRERLAQSTTPGCDLALVLFDEIEKAAPALTTLLLGILDRATLRLGDGREVDFTRTLIFLTSNLGAREMMRELGPGMGFRASGPAEPPVIADKLESIALAAVRRRFSPEFVNRIDVVVTYQPLDTASLSTIVEHQVNELQQHVNTRLGDRSFSIHVSDAARELLLRKGTSPEYGARELKRVIHRLLTQPLAARVARGLVEPGSTVEVEVAEDGETLALHTVSPAVPAAVGIRPSAAATVAIVDDNNSLLDWMELLLTSRGFVVQKADTLASAEALSVENVDAAVLDYVLPDGDGLTLAARMQRRRPGLLVIVVSGLQLSDEDRDICSRRGYPFLRKPFLGDELVKLLQSGLSRSVSAGK